MLGKMTCSRSPARRFKFRPFECHRRPHSFLSYLTASLAVSAAAWGLRSLGGYRAFSPVFQDWAAIPHARGFGSQLPIHPKKSKLRYPKPTAAFSPAQAVLTFSFGTLILQGPWRGHE